MERVSIIYRLVRMYDSFHGNKNLYYMQSSRCTNKKTDLQS